MSFVLGMNTFGAGDECVRAGDEHFSAGDERIENTRLSINARLIPLPSHVERSQDGQYLPADSIVNYAVVFNQLRNPGAAVGR